jgi:hypothetical protein
MLDDKHLTPFVTFFRDLKSKSKPLSFIRGIVKNQLKGGNLTNQQYQKSVSKFYDYLFSRDYIFLQLSVAVPLSIFVE